MSLGTAIRIAALVHEKQKDRGGFAYITHPIRVMQSLNTRDEEIMSIAVLHDVLEDGTNWTLARLKAEGMSDRTLSALLCLTHPKEESYEKYIDRVATNEDAIVVKLADLEDNMRASRLKGLRPKDFERLEKYCRAYTFLQGVLDARKKAYPTPREMLIGWHNAQHIHCPSAMEMEALLAVPPAATFNSKDCPNCGGLAPSYYHCGECGWDYVSTHQCVKPSVVRDHGDKQGDSL